VIPLAIPPLREHADDIPILARHFVQLKASEQGKSIPTLSETAVTLLIGHDWPGNVRELENVMERAVVFCRTAEIGPELLGALGEGAGYVMLGWDEARKLALRRFARSYLTLVLRIHRGSVTDAAKAMSISRQALYKNLEEAGVDPDSFRT
jgi:DNA-binding NtrC family response regulator